MIHSKSWRLLPALLSLSLVAVGCEEDSIDPVVDAAAVLGGGDDGAGGMGGQPDTGGMGGTPDMGEPADMAQPADMGTPSPTCEAYCALMADNCPASYPDAAACLAVCATLPDDGAEGDEDGNTVQCRTYHAGVAADDAALHCPHAGASGGGVCGTYCEAYCSIVEDSCGDIYPDTETCMSECAAFPQDGEPDTTAGDSVQCRIYHGSFPALADPATHCAHTTPSGGAVCGAYCDVYCNRVEANCEGLYPDRQTCMDLCGQIPADGQPGDTAGNSVQCRIYHGNLPAAADPDLHCAHAALSGGEMCGSYCDVYCDMVDRNCAESAGFPDRDACLSTCEAFPTDGAPVETAGNSVQCRIYHSSYPAELDPVLHCPHASAGGEDFCGGRCEGYCSQMMTHCPESYGSFEDCLSFCALIPDDGEVGDTVGNTVQCRTYHGSFPAAGDPSLHCPHAGLTGGDMCGDYCEVYCDFVDAHCSDDPQLYDDRAACEAACVEFSTYGREGDTSGNTVQCRIYHASFPSFADPMFHCTHAQPEPTDFCLAPPACEGYCASMMDNCAGIYPDLESCMTVCELFPANGAEGDEAGNSSQCRATYATRAADDPAQCAAASINGGGVCGDYCASYCGIVMQTCAGQYPDVDTCLIECAQFPEDGAFDTTDGDSVQCRTYHASFPAAADPILHCPHTGPDGAGFCGEPCEVYCNRMDQNCPDAYPDRGTCEAACALFPADGESGATTGDTVQCRIYHGGVPASDNGELHCPHAGNTGGDMCGAYCEVYCRNVLTHCTDELDIYGGDMGSCMAACEAFPTNGEDGATDGNSVQCRIYHASFPSEDSPPVHCPHAGLTGGGMCGDACDAYCDQLDAHCVGDNAQYPSRAACRAGCSELSRDGLFTDIAGDSVQCRAYHASFPSAMDPVMHCPHAGFDGGGVCVDMD